MRIVITGANGQLGSELKDILLQDSTKECFFLDRKELPLDQPLLISSVLAKYQPDLIIHAGAYTAVDLAESESDLAAIVNHDATAEIAKYCHHNKIKLIAISTDYVFDGNSDSPLSENALVDPINMYGLTKLKGEQAIQKWLPEAIIIRTSWVYSTYGKNFVKTMIKLMQERDEISVINDQIGSPTYAHDLAVAIAAIIDLTWVGGIYHYSNEGALSWYDFAVAIRDIKELDCKINAIPSTSYPTPAKRPRYSLLDKSKIRNTFNVNVPHWRDSLVMMLSK